MAHNTAKKLNEFIYQLHLGNSVSKAALIAGISTSGAYARRARDKVFAAEWDKALGEIVVHDKHEAMLAYKNRCISNLVRRNLIDHNVAALAGVQIDTEPQVPPECPLVDAVRR